MTTGYRYSVSLGLGLCALALYALGTWQKHDARQMLANQMGTPQIVKNLKGQLSDDEFAKAKDAISCSAFNPNCVTTNEPYNWKLVSDAVSGMSPGPQRTATFKKALEHIFR